MPVLLDESVRIRLFVWGYLAARYPDDQAAESFWALVDLVDDRRSESLTYKPAPFHVKDAAGAALRAEEFDVLRALRELDDRALCIIRDITMRLCGQTASFLDGFRSAALSELSKTRPDGQRISATPRLTSSTEDPAR